jgi:hypothetical protein
MGSKLKCPSCGAKNDLTSYRCRMCTAVINPDAAKPVEEEPAAPPPPLADHFDAGEISRQIAPARTRFGAGPSGLGARLAAANGGQPPERYSTPASVPSLDPPPPDQPDPGPIGAPSESWNAEPVSAWETEEPAAPIPPPIVHDEEPFDADALFRDMR